MDPLSFIALSIALVGLMIFVSGLFYHLGSIQGEADAWHEFIYMQTSLSQQRAVDEKIMQDILKY